MEEKLKKVLSSSSDIKRMGLSLESIILALKDGQLFNNISEQEVKKHLNQVLKEKNGYIIKSHKKEKGTGRVLYKLRPVRTPGGRPGRTKPDTDVTDTTFIGKAGEMAVISELLYGGYTASTMIVDKGIDIVASKDNKFYYIQVKTTYYDENGKCSISIPRASYERVSSLGNVSFVIVIRNAIGVNDFIVFTQRDIDLDIRSNNIEMSDSNVNIKIEIDDIDKKPYLYNGRRKKDISAYKNNFKLA